MLKLLKNILGLVLICGSIGLGIYVGFWLMFIGGIIEVINSITPVVNNAGIAWGIVKIIFADVIGIITFFVVGGIGALLLE